MVMIAHELHVIHHRNTVAEDRYSSSVSFLHSDLVYYNHLSYCYYCYYHYYHSCFYHYHYQFYTYFYVYYVLLHLL